MHAQEDTGWQWPLLLGIQVTGALLLASFFVDSPLRAYWERLDVEAFYALNGLLDAGRFWELFWAVGNHRAFDLVGASLLAGSFLWGLWRSRVRHLEAALAALLFCVLLVPASGAFLSNTLNTYQRESPTLVLEQPMHLSERVPQFRTKDASGKSFPGDHALILALGTGVLWSLFGKVVGGVAMLGTLLLCLPRLVSGAHWLTDCLLGSFLPAAMFLACVFATPLHALLHSKTTRLARALLRPLRCRSWMGPKEA